MQDTEYCTLHTVQYILHLKLYLHLKLHLYTSYYALSTAHCTQHIYTACCWMSSKSSWWRKSEHQCILNILIENA